MAQTEIIQADKPQSGEVTTGGNAALSLLQNSLANPDYPAERIDKALEWVERLEKKAAVEQFNASFAEMQSEMPVAPKTAKATRTHVMQLWKILSKPPKHIWRNSGSD